MYDYDECHSMLFASEEKLNCLQIKKKNEPTLQYGK